MPKNAKAKAKAPTIEAASALKSRALETPAPFVFPEEKLKPFLEWLDVRHIYITHIDDHPVGFKLQLFCVPVFMNTALMALLVWRAWTIAPYYYLLLLTLWGEHTQYWIDVKAVGWETIMDQVVRRTMTFMFDLFLVRFVGQWPFDFVFARPASPVSWRWAVGFQDKEIAVRVSRPWDAKLPPRWWREENGDDGGVFADRIMPAIDRRWIAQKSAYMMLDKSWDLDFNAMVQAHQLVDTKILKLADFRKQVLIYTEEHGWLTWPVAKLDEGADAETDKGRQKIVAFKDTLTAMGKENLFFRWIEIVQFESEQPGGFTAERQARAMKEARRAFEEQGVDFDQFWKDVGGMEGMPGLEKQV